MGLSDTVTRPKFVDKDDPRRFDLKSGVVKGWAETASGERIDLENRGQLLAKNEIKSLIDPGDKMFLSGTVSSNVKDRQGDILDSQCQASMLRQAKGLTAWLNHDYTVPGSILGTCMDASMHTRTSDDGEVLDLDVETQIDDENPLAVKSWRHVAVKNTKLAYSIGGIFLDFDIVEPDDDDDFWSWLFPDLVVHDIELLEYSLVGIPANPRAYTRSADPKGFGKSASAFGSTKGLHAEIERIGKRVGRKAVGDAANRLLLKKSILGDRTAAKKIDELPAASVPENAPPAPTHLLVADVIDEAETEIEQPEAVAIADVAPEDTAVDQSTDDASPVGDETPADEVAPAESETLDPGAAVPVLVDKAIVPTTKATTDTNDEDEGTGNGDQFSPIVDDGPKQKRVVKSMRAIRRGMSHGLCTESMMHAVKAHKAMSSLLPDDYDIPSDAALPEDDDANVDDAATRAIGEVITILEVNPTDEQVAAIKAAFAEPYATIVSEPKTVAPDTSALDEIVAKRIEEQTALDAVLERKAQAEREFSDLQAKLVQLKATPIGRQSAHPDGSRDGESGSLAQPDAYAKSQQQLSREVGARIASGGADARSRVS